jgi:hypothetical protein
MRYNLDCVLGLKHPCSASLELHLPATRSPKRPAAESSLSREIDFAYFALPH